MSSTERGNTLVRVNRLKDSWTWNVSVVANDNTLEQLREAKDAALRIAYELRDELSPSGEKNAAKDPSEIPF